MDNVCGIQSGGELQCKNLEALSGTFLQVAVGDQFYCAIDSQQNIQCSYGAESQGYLPIPTEKFVQIDSGTSHTCGIDVEGAVHCWGIDEYGETVTPSGYSSYPF